MIINFLVLFFLIMLAVFFGWLTFLAIRAKRVWVKIIGGLAGGLATLLMVVLVFVGGKGLVSMYFPGADPAPELQVEGTPEQVARGEYLVNVSCVGCHGQAGPDGNRDSQPLSGGLDLAAEQDLGFMGSMVAENLTPGGKLADYSDGEIFRTIRQSVSKEGYRLAAMSYLPYSQLSDEDTKAIVAYLRSLPAAESPQPTGDRVNFVSALLTGSGLIPEMVIVRGEVTAPEPGATAEYGAYVAALGDCRTCHGLDMTGMPASVLGPAIINPRPFVSVLSLEQFVETMRSGVRPNGVAFPETMPWQNVSRMSDLDLAALYTYLITPVE
jgi:mono/diheme cytochrome c family protein